MATMRESSRIKTALVTGATGFVATELIKQLLEKGYNVSGSVRNLESQGSTFLRQLGDCLPGQLRLFEADVMVPHAFDEEVKEARFIFHTASPCIIAPSDPHKDLIDVAVIGTENILDSVIKHKSKQRIILTSGTTAVRSPFHSTRKPGQTLTSSEWNDDSSVENRESYPLSKVLQERKAWQMANEADLDLISILPAATLGPFLSPVEDTFSLTGVLKGLLTIPGCPTFNFCDVRDVCKAHILAAENPSAHGRYLLSFSTPAANQSAEEAFCRLFPECNLSSVKNFAIQADMTKIEDELGMQTMDPQCVWADSFRTARQLNLLPEELLFKMAAKEIPKEVSVIA